MKYLILLLLPLSVSFDDTPQTKGVADIIGCVKTCTVGGSKILAKCSRTIPPDNSKDDSNSKKNSKE